MGTSFNILHRLSKEFKNTKRLTIEIIPQIKMKTIPLLLLTTMVAIFMENTTTEYLLVKIDGKDGGDLCGYNPCSDHFIAKAIRQKKGREPCADPHCVWSS